MKVLVGSNNPVKLDAVKEAFEKYHSYMKSPYVHS